MFGFWNEALDAPRGLLKPSDYSAVLAVSVISYFDDGICFQLV